jgi:hypothetical protein
MQAERQVLHRRRLVGGCVWYMDKDWVNPVIKECAEFQTVSTTTGLDGFAWGESLVRGPRPTCSRSIFAVYQHPTTTTAHMP